MKIREIKQHNSFSITIIILLFIFDILSFYYSYYGVIRFLKVGPIINSPFIILIGIILLFYFFGRYNPSSLQSRSKEFKIIVLLTVSSTFIYLVYKLGLKIITIQQSQNIVILSLLFLLFAVISRLTIRTIQKQLLKLNIGLRNTIIIGSSNNGYQFLESISENKYLGYKVFAYCDSLDTKERKEELERLFDKKYKINSRFLNCYIGSFLEIEEFIVKNKINEVIIALSKDEDDLLLNIITKLKNYNVCIKIVPNIYDVLKGYAKMHNVTGMPLIDINPNILTEFQIILKRFMDVFISIFGLLVMFVPFLIIMFLIKVSSSGNIIFKQKRIGLNGVEFIVHKFRTMHSNSEHKTGPVWASKNDPRVTPLGKILRKTRLDEFPQLYDVLIGNMSIVGPRPERNFFINKLKEKFPYYMRRLNVRPGITGWAQVMGDYDTTLEDVENKLKLDFYYIENISIWLDIKIIILTFWIMLRGQGH